MQVIVSERSKREKNKNRSGLDVSKRTASSLFYLPCQAKYQNDSFFKEYSEERTALDPVKWIQNSVFEFESFGDSGFENRVENREPDQIRIEAAKKEWRNTPEGMGNDRFFDFSIQLRKAGMRDCDIETTLKEEAAYANSPADRKRQIPGIMKSLTQARATVGD